MNNKQKWSVYILKCLNGSLYTGVTNDLKRRLQAHSTGRGAKYTRAFGVEKLVYREAQKNKGAALRREAEIKGWDRKEKIKLIKTKKAFIR